jgi:predicted LPLAT superfamily acyltransferase
MTEHLPTVTASHQRGNTGVNLDLHIRPDLLWFHGHFPGTPILPGVVQIHWAVDFARRYLGLDLDTAREFQIKFKAVIQPDDAVVLTLDHGRRQAPRHPGVSPGRRHLCHRLDRPAMNAPFSPCAVVPTHNHWRALADVVAGLRQRDLPVLIIDDGSEDPATIAALHDPDAGVRVVRRPVNGGKGAAVMDGFRLAHAAGYTHVVQVDADGQHDLAALPLLLATARANPHSIISGAPQYDESMPLGRRIGRWITHLWVFIETLSFGIRDSMCGFRVYPLPPCLALMDTEHLGSRMDFDIEILVRLFWRGIKPIMVPVRVIYPPDNISNFHVLRDNLRISWMHTRLVVAMLWRLLGGGRCTGAGHDVGSAHARKGPRPFDPIGLIGMGSRDESLAGAGQRPANVPVFTPVHWAALTERGPLWGLRFVAAVYALLGRRVCLWIMAPIVFTFFCTGGEQRRASRVYLGRVLNRRASTLEIWRHFMDFAGRAVDVFAAWSGAIPACSMMTDSFTDPRGALLVVSHHGAVELARALMDPALRNRLTLLVHTRHAENYNRLLAQFRDETASRMIQVTEIGPDTAILLRACIERGEWVAIAGDRVPVSSAGRVVRVPFLGEPAAFSQGPWLLAALLDCPVHLLFCRRQRPGHWALTLEPFAERVTLPRGRREEAMTEYATAYATRLERECREAPWQWYNFFNFWEGR